MKNIEKKISFDCEEDWNKIQKKISNEKNITDHFSLFQTDSYFIIENNKFFVKIREETKYENNKTSSSIAKIEYLRDNDMVSNYKIKKYNNYDEAFDDNKEYNYEYPIKRIVKMRNVKILNHHIRFHFDKLIEPNVIDPYRMEIEIIVNEKNNEEYCKKLMTDLTLKFKLYKFKENFRSYSLQ